ncbi:diketogulonate reductase-like aldo/keto reductase [Amycolatopsis bartoniae]|uniref:Oxidoreductase n=1 Tax=Amycolatopsis bartoniae TaxID=941986 RepID=A0A8H9J6Y6_9PSEU|nr:aldo/keto reductase [Amycolatopsis bartoniae]MBB2938662.1 diketogulonate reductase-like aldo/keto reductase [Amycolatopsis bartoniae]TVT08846.1 aldo/keto reductase [Amycolatopsis bartoniae]GHF83882.1 oxidoreductase [Amycolatopsis bartoniae]
MATTVTSPHDTFELNNGVRIPVIGLGVFQTPPEQTVQAVEVALRAGYRHIDTAAAYRNEREVGEGIRRSGIPREAVFVETKIWVSDFGYDQTLHAFDKATAKLGFDTIDLLLLHQPAVDAFDRTIGAYRALEKLLTDGRVRAIGVSNFTPALLDRLLGEVEVVPAVNQIELHPYFTQADTQRADAEHDILTQAWSPIGGITFYRGNDGGPGKSTLTDPTLRQIADRYGKTPAQVMLRWHLQQGRSAIPKSTDPARLAENIDIFDFTLTRADLAAIDALDTGVRGGPDPEQPQPRFFDLRIPEATSEGSRS